MKNVFFRVAFAASILGGANSSFANTLVARARLGATNSIQIRRNIKKSYRSGAIIFILAVLLTNVGHAQITPQTKPIQVVSPTGEFKYTDPGFAFRVLNAPPGATYQLYYADSARRQNFAFTNRTALPSPTVPIDNPSGYSVQTVYTSTIPEIKNLLTLGNGTIAAGDKSINMRVYDSAGTQIAQSRFRKLKIDNPDVSRYRFDALRNFYYNRAGQNIVDYYWAGSSGKVRAAGKNFYPQEYTVNANSFLHEQDDTPYLFRHSAYGGSAYGGFSDYYPDLEGGWFDAGDQGKYTVNGAVALWHLFNLIERDLGDLIKDGANSTTSQRKFWRKNNYNDIPNNPASLIPGTNYDFPTASPTELPNIIKEARYEMEWLLRMQISGVYSDGFNDPKISVLARLPIGNQDVPYDKNKGYGVKPAYSAGETESMDYTTDFPYIVEEGTWDSGKLVDPHTRKQVNLVKQVIKVTNRLTKESGKLVDSGEPIVVNGMVLHSVHDASWTLIPTLPAQNNEQRVYEYPTTAATLSLAAVAAQCSRIFKNIDPDFANKCLAASDLAFDKGYTHKPTDDGDDTTDDNVYFYGEYSNAAVGNPNGNPLPATVDGGGAYADNRIDDLVYWARMERYITYKLREEATGQAQNVDGLLNDMICQNGLVNTKAGVAPFVSGSPSFPAQSASWLLAYNWANNASLGTISAVTAYPKKFVTNDALTEICSVKTSTGNTLISKSTASPSTNLIAYANTLASRIDSNAWGLPIKSDFVYEWGSNHELANAAILAGVAVDVANTYNSTTKLNEKVKLIPKNVGYHLLGSNALGKSMVTGDYESATNIHHRTFAKQKDASSIATPPGWLVGGPNGQIDQAVLGASRYPIYAHLANKGVFNTGSLKKDDGSYGGYMQLMSVLPNCRDRDQWGQALNTNGKVFTYYGGQLATRSALCYSDNYWSYHTNEVAINWQASWLWLSAYLGKNP